MQDAVETVLARQLACVLGMFRRPDNSGNDSRSLNENNLMNRNFHSHQNLSEPGEESPYNVLDDLASEMNILIEIVA